MPGANSLAERIRERKAGAAERAAAKPPYRAMSMEEIRAMPWNGLNAISFFAGTGGSSTGYRMAGYRMLYANEFVDAARACYAANAAEYTYVDGRDIRTVTPEDVLEKIKLKVGELDVLDGSPPCSAFSTAGIREKGWGKAKNYSDDKQQVVDDLFFEYARMVRGIRPKVFVAENVSGLIKGKAKGYFIEIITALKKDGYNVQAGLLDAQWLGVPQARQRVIFIGVREDLGKAPAFPKPFQYNYSVREALTDLGISVVGFKGASGAPYTGKKAVHSIDNPAPTIITSSNQFEVERELAPVVEVQGSKSALFAAKGRKYPLDEPSPTILAHPRLDVRREGEDPLDERGAIVSEIVAVGGNGQFGEEKWQTPDKPARTIGASPSTGNGKAGGGDVMVKRTLVGVGGVLESGFSAGKISPADKPSPTIMAGGGGGMNTSQFGVVEKVERVSVADSFDPEKGASMEGYATGDEWDRLDLGQQSDKYFSLVKPDPEQPCPTVTASGGPPNTASVTHPYEKRKFTIPELKRICGFPDDFILTGSYAQQWERLGRAVPPVMMLAIAKTVKEQIFT